MKAGLISLLCLVPMVAFCAKGTPAKPADDGMAAEQALLLGTAKPEPKKEIALRDTKISADHMEYNYKEAVAVMTDNVVVDDARFYLTADRLFLFLDGTNSLDQLVVQGNVAVENENRRAFCDRAVYTHADAKLVMVGNAVLVNVGDDGKESRVKGDKITIWTEEQRMEVYPKPMLEFPASAGEGLKGMMK